MGHVKKSKYSATDNSLSGVTLHDLYREIMSDTSMSMVERQTTINQVKGLIGGMPAGTPISSLMSRGLGGLIGYLIAKYFGMSPAGKAVSALTGYGLGKVVHDQFNKPPDTNPPGWKIL